MFCAFLFPLTGLLGYCHDASDMKLYQLIGLAAPAAACDSSSTLSGALLWRLCEVFLKRYL